MKQTNKLPKSRTQGDFFLGKGIYMYIPEENLAIVFWQLAEKTHSVGIYLAITAK